MGIGLAALLVVFAPTWIAMAKVWANSETYGHGMAVAPIALWLVWRQRAQLAELAPGISWVGVAGLAVCCLGWLAAELAGINVVTQFAFTGRIACLGYCRWEPRSRALRSAICGKAAKSACFGPGTRLRVSGSLQT